MTENALAVLEQKDAVQYFVANGLDPIIEKIRAEVKSFVPDISTEKGRKDIASLAYKVAQSKNAIDELGKNLVSGIKERAKGIDLERARAWNAIEAIQKDVRKPLTEWEEKDKKRIADHKTHLDMLNGLLAFPLEPSMAEVQRRYDLLFTYQGREFEEFTALANAAKQTALTGLKQKIESMKKAEADKLELERLQKAEQERLQKERDERLQAEAAAKAKADAEAKAKQEADALAAKVKADAEKAENERLAALARAKKAEDDRIAAEEKAKADAIAAEAKAKRDADAAVQRERERAEAEKKAEAEAAAKREADKKHRAKINNEALDAILNVLDDGNLESTSAAGKAIIAAIAKGEIPHIKISY